MSHSTQLTQTKSELPLSRNAGSNFSLKELEALATIIKAWMGRPKCWLIEIEPRRKTSIVANWGVVRKKNYSKYMFTFVTYQRKTDSKIASWQNEKV